jgi:predicted nucleic acid-binding protein
MTRTFIDAGVLIAAARGQHALSLLALAALDDPDREFASSVFVQLEVLPKALFHRQEAETEFYQAFFAAVKHWAAPQKVCRIALELASESGLSAIDALHVAAASVVDAEELITTEGSTKPLHRTRRVKVISIVPTSI